MTAHSGMPAMLSLLQERDVAMRLCDALGGLCALGVASRLQAKITHQDFPAQHRWLEWKSKKTRV